MTDYAADAPDFHAWAGRGPNARLILESGPVRDGEDKAYPEDNSALTTFLVAVNSQVASLVADGMMDVEDALAAYDPEKIAAGVAAAYGLLG
jgi:hypothetical protein